MFVFPTLPRDHVTTSEPTTVERDVEEWLRLLREGADRSYLELEWKKMALRERERKALARAERNRKKHERKKRQQAELEAEAKGRAAVRRWQWAINKVMKENRHNKAETLKHAAELQRQRDVRVAALEARETSVLKDAQTRPSTTQPGIKPTFGKGAAEPLTVSDRAAAAGKKAIALQERKEVLKKQREEQRQKEAERTAVDAERERNLEVGRAMMRNEKESIVHRRAE